MDGSVLERVITGEGIVRDHKGKCTGGFSVCYGTGTNTLAEILALKGGLKLCLELNISSVIVESDSMVVVSTIRTAPIGNWRLKYPFREFLNLFYPKSESHSRYL